MRMDIAVAVWKNTQWRVSEVIGMYSDECEIKGFTQREARVVSVMRLQQYGCDRYSR